MFLKIGIPILVVIAIAGGIFFKKYSKSDKTPDGDKSSQVENTSLIGPGNTRDTSEASLDGDLASIEAELKTLDSDSEKVDEGLDDKPISIEE